LLKGDMMKIDKNATVLDVINMDTDIMEKGDCLFSGVCYSRCGDPDSSCGIEMLLYDKEQGNMIDLNKNYYDYISELEGRIIAHENREDAKIKAENEANEKRIAIATKRRDTLYKNYFENKEIKELRKSIKGEENFISTLTSIARRNKLIASVMGKKDFEEPDLSKEFDKQHEKIKGAQARIKELEKIKRNRSKDKRKGI